MAVSRDDRVRMERAHVRAWPALRTQAIDGWLWRCSGGGSQRANSVSTVDFTGGDAEAAIAVVESLYAEAGVPARFQTFDETAPASFDAMLQWRGYCPGEVTATMFKRIERRAPVADVTVSDHPWDEWRQAYLNEITPNRQEVNSLILDRIPAPRAFFGCIRNGRIVSTGLCVVSFGCAVIECVTTRVEARRQGLALSMMRALEHWCLGQQADLLGLQVVATNLPAVALYRKLGFEAGAQNRFWVRDSGHTSPASGC